MATLRDEKTGNKIFLRSLHEFGRNPAKADTVLAAGSKLCQSQLNLTYLSAALKWKTVPPSQQLARNCATRRHGIGRALIAETEKWAAGNAYPDVRLRSDMQRRDEAHLFYERIGYTPSKQAMMFKKDMPIP